MRKLIYIVILGSLLSCNQEAQKILTELPNEIENVQESNEPTEGEKVATRLSEIAPLSEEALRKAFPKQLKQLPVDEDIMVIGQQVIGGFGDRTITLSITDAAGNNNQLASQAIDGYRFNKVSEENDSFKVVKKERDGIETHTDYYMKTCKSEMVFLFNKRFYISLSNNDNRGKLIEDQL
jgi:hypothetical protein